MDSKILDAAANGRAVSVDDAVAILAAAQAIVAKEPNVVHVPAPASVAADTHGQYPDTRHLLNLLQERQLKSR